ncbi:uncharacterized protein [Amphiura filiformis]|uniref:uncharacterized protein n=1 Tax=Amphiura filiformis TaxID=82378 RepID=UPI003B225407
MGYNQKFVCCLVLVIVSQYVKAQPDNNVCRADGEGQCGVEINDNMYAPTPTPTEEYFQFTIATGVVEGEQVRVTVYRPQLTGKEIAYTAAEEARYKPSDQNTRNLLNMLVPLHLEIEPQPTATLVTDPRNRNLRIDTQPATTKYRNIHIQSGPRSFAVTTIDEGGQFCFEPHYERKLLKYLKEGLYQSLRSKMQYNIRVTIEKRRKPNTWVIVEPATKAALHGLRAAIKARLKHKAEEIVGKRMTSAKNINKIAKESDMIEHVFAAIEKNINVAKITEKEGGEAVAKNVAKITEKEGGEAVAKNVAKIAEKEGLETVAKKIPVVSTCLGIFFGMTRAAQGDFEGALAEVASGLLADIPGPGTALSLTIDAALMARDIRQAYKDEENHKKILAQDIEELKKQNEQIRADLQELLPESPIYGDDSSGNYFTETDIANVDDITKIHIRSGMLINAIQVEYRHGGLGAYHGSKGGTPSTFVLNSDERITKVEVRICPSCLAVGSISFFTDCGRMETFGRYQSKVQTFEMIDGAYLGAIKGYDKTGEEPAKRGVSCKGNYGLLPAIGFVPKVMG